MGGELQQETPWLVTKHRLRRLAVWRTAVRFLQDAEPHVLSATTLGKTRGTSWKQQAPVVATFWGNLWQADGG